MIACLSTEMFGLMLYICWVLMFRVANSLYTISSASSTSSATGMDSMCPETVANCCCFETMVLMWSMFFFSRFNSVSAMSSISLICFVYLTRYSGMSCPF